MRLSPLHVLLALVISIVANAALLLALAVPPASEPRRASREPTEVPFPAIRLPPERPPPPEPRRPIEMEAPAAARPEATRAQVRAPNLPSAFRDPAVGSLDADLGALRPSAGSETDDVPADDSIREADRVEQPPRVRSRRLPRFPETAETEGVEGYVVLRLLIDRSGQVAAVRVESAQPPGVFEEAASAAVRGWRFIPARDGGRPVPVWARKTLRFELQ